MNINENIISILDQIDAADETYYNEDYSIISDQEYDLLKDSIKSFNDSFSTSSKSDKELKARVEQTLSRVGAPVSVNSDWKKVSHLISMQSLNKVNTPEEFSEKFSFDKSIFCSEKLDGISISLRYIDGKLVTAITRGSGDAGYDITPNVKRMKGVIKDLKNDFSGHIRGEIILLHSDFEKHFSDLANTRNAASGVAKRLDGEGCNHLSVKFYTLEPDKEIPSIKTEEDAFAFIKNLGFETPNYYTLNSYDECISLWRKYMEETRSNIDYDIDGLVFRVNNISEQITLGDLNNRPKGAIAFKFENTSKESTLTDVVWQVGDTGIICPVACFEQVNLLGTKIERASLHNYNNIKKLGIYIGARILVERGNDVIPAITKVINPDASKVIKPITECPCCNSTIITRGAYLVCDNYNCPAIKIGRLNKWVKELGILEWGQKNIQKMIDAGLVSDVADIYKLTVDQISSLDRMGERSAENLVNELNKYREISLENFIGGLSINNVATSTVKKLVKAGYNSIDKLKNVSINQLQNVDGIGYTKAEAFYNGMKDCSDRIDDILNAGVTIKAITSGNLTNKSFAITGSTELSRKEIIKLIEDNGGEYKKSIGKDCTFLIIDDVNSSTSKAVAAKKNNIKLISEQQFLDMVK